MKRRGFHAMALAMAAGAMLAACGGGDDPPALVLGVNAAGTSTIDANVLATRLAAYPLAALSAEEAASLAFMRQEEQLAHDVYAISATLYAPPIFANIADSEATHAAAVKTLLDRYAQPDPLAGLAAGSFASPVLQSLFDGFAAASRTGLVPALQVGVEIEELDIRDLAVQMALVDNADILMVYGHLQRGSRNHLRAFMKVLVQQGGSYVPKYLTQAEFDAIVNSPIETGS